MELPAELMSRGIHPVFHASKLRPCIPNDDVRFPNRSLAKILGFGPTDVTIAERVERHVGQGTDASFEIIWANGQKSWEPYGAIKHLTVLADYLEATGTGIESLNAPTGPTEKNSTDADSMEIPISIGCIGIDMISLSPESPASFSSMQLPNEQDLLFSAATDQNRSVLLDLFHKLLIYGNGSTSPLDRRYDSPYWQAFAAANNLPIDTVQIQAWLTEVRNSRIGGPPRPERSGPLCLSSSSSPYSCSTCFGL